MSDTKPAKAVIYRLKEIAAGTAEKPATVQLDGDPIPVQFNPTSLKIERTNDASGGVTTAAQRRIHPNEGHATLSLELEYDTAEGDEDGMPLDVRARTQDVRQFAEPPDNDPKKAPPRLRFIWGNFTFDGIVSRISEDIDYFSSEGLALRAKVSLTITSQNLKFESNATGPGARNDSGATTPGGAQKAAGPGGKATTTPDTAADAQDGESVQQALTRLGLDPAAWRSAMAGLTSPLELTAGAQLQVDASVNAGGGLGVTTDSAPASPPVCPPVCQLEASAGLAAAVTPGESSSASASLVASATAGVGATGGGTVGAAAQADAGFALAAVGGVDAAIQGVLAAQADAGVTAARGSFALPAASPADPSAVAVATGTASAAAVTGGVRARQEVDTRAVTFGRGVPLKPAVIQR